MDIDIDICPSKKSKILNEIKIERGQNFLPDIDDVARENLGCVMIATFGTETTRSSVITAARGYRSDEFPDGVDSDTSQYLSSLVPSERGFDWTIGEVMRGNPEKARQPVYPFVRKINEYEGLIDIVEGIESLVNKRSSHASGVLLLDEDPYVNMAYMRTPSGDVITQFDLHDCEYLGYTKYDFLVTSVQEKILTTINLLQEHDEIDKNLSLREAYDKYLHPTKIDLKNKKLWSAIQKGEVLDLFQFDTEVGGQAVKKIQPDNVFELSEANSLMRLMPAGPQEESPMEKYVRYKNNIDLWYQEMSENGLTANEVAVLEKYLKPSYGVVSSQESLMWVLMDKDICGFSLGAANAARKIVGKKQMSKIPELKKKVLQSAKSPALGLYVWKYVAGPQMGYSFSLIHSNSYTLVGIQTAYLATHWNPIYWNTACLIVNSSSDDNEDTKERKKSNDYGKQATAIGDIQHAGIKISLIDINKSGYTFEPDIESDSILFGIKALNGVGEDVATQIIAQRPYKSFKDFLNHKIGNKTSIISLIKAGAFDNLAEEKLLASQLGIHPRVLVMAYYLSLTSNFKKNLTLSNMPSIMQYNLLPDELEYYKNVYLINKKIKEEKYKLGAGCLEFVSTSPLSEYITIENGESYISEKVWSKYYEKSMDFIRKWLSENKEKLLHIINMNGFKAEWDKYAVEPNLSKWEMDSMCFYYHEHELTNVDKNAYGISDFETLPTAPVVDWTFPKDGRQIPIYKTTRIIGTVIDKDDKHGAISLLTLGGVVTVKFTKEYFALYNRTISEMQENGKKKTIEEGWTKRGTKLMLTGFRRDDQFVVKKYRHTASERIYKITELTDNGRRISITHDRAV